MNKRIRKKHALIFLKQNGFDYDKMFVSYLIDESVLNYLKKFIESEKQKKFVGELLKRCKDVKKLPNAIKLILDNGYFYFYESNNDIFGFFSTEEVKNE